MKRLLLVSIAASALVLSLQAASGLSSGAPSKWANIQVGITYRLYQPGKTLGFKPNTLRTASCGKGKEPWVEALYGTYNGVLGSKSKGFALYEGHPICSNPGESTKIGLLKVMGKYVYLGVYCESGKHCTGADGFKNGFTVQWKAKPSSPYKKNTQMQLDTSHLTFKQLTKLAEGLKKVG